MRKPKNYTSGLLPVYLKITVNGQPKEISTKRNWNPAKWSSEAGRALGNKEDVKTLNAYLDELQQMVYQARKSLLENNRPITADAIKCILTGNTEKKKSILTVFRHHNEQMKALEGVDFAPGTVERYTTSYKHTEEFISWKYGTNDLPIADLDFEFMSEYSFWLKSIRKCNHNTTMKYLANFKKIVLICVKNRWLPSDPFEQFKLSKRIVDRHPLSNEELLMIEKKTFVTERLNIVRDMFLFSCYTGLSYIDLKLLKTSEITMGIDQEKWIFAKRQKTKTQIHIPILKPALKLIDKYRNHPKCLNEGLVFPVLTNQKMNSYLKEIADCCGITKNLTFHIARHTFATTITLGNGVPMDSVSKMLGHTNLIQTQHYAKVLDTKISQDMQQLKKNLE